MCAGQFVSRSFVVLLRKKFPQNHNLQTAVVRGVMHLDCMNEYQQEVIEYFGYWPAFCDAHILYCSEAENNLILKIDYIDSGKSLRAEVQITFKSIFEVNLERYENSNVIDTLSILSGNNHWVTIEPCFGFGGTFKCRSIEAKIVEA